MKVAGKYLQDIYDAGSRRLEELADAQKEQLNGAGDSHLAQRDQIAPKALEQLQDRSTELEQEISAYLAHGLERVEKVVAAETQQSERYIQRLVDGLGLPAKRFSESISQLKETAERHLGDVSSDNERLFKSCSQAFASQISHAGVSAIDAGKSSGGQAHCALITSIEDSFHSLLDSESQAVAQVRSDFDANAKQLDDNCHNCQSEIEACAGDKLAKLEVRSMESTEAIHSTVQKLTEIADKYAFDSDVKLKESFSALLYETSSAFEASSGKAASDITSVHESSVLDLTRQSQELKDQMDIHVSEAAASAARKLLELQDKGNSLLGGYIQELEQRYETSRDFQRDLEKERQDMVSEVHVALSAVCLKFDQKLQTLAQAMLGRMKHICDEAETAIVASQHACIAESKHYATDRQSAIELAGSDFVQLVKLTKIAALDAITLAASSSSDEASLSNQESKAVDEKDSDTRPAGSNGRDSSAPESVKRKRASKSGDVRQEGNEK